MSWWEFMAILTGSLVLDFAQFTIEDRRRRNDTKVMLALMDAQRRGARDVLQDQDHR